MSEVKKYKTRYGFIGTVIFEDDKGCLIEWKDDGCRNFWDHHSILTCLTEYKERVVKKVRRYVHNEPDSNDTVVVSRFEDYCDRAYIAQFDIILTDGKVTGVELVE